MAQHARGEISLVYTPQDSRQQLTRRDEKLDHPVAHDFTYPQPTRSRSKWWLFGYDRQSSVVLWGVFSAAIIAFCLARAPMMSFQQLLKMTTPGEGYWYEQAPWKGSVLIHVITATISSFFSVFCFLPITFQRWPRFHSILGYAVTLLLLASMTSGSLLGRRSQGGELNFQAGVYMIGSMTAYAGVMGILEARNRAYDKHREWMLRAWFYNGTLLTTRLTALISSHVVTALNGYYSLWKCGEVAYVLKSIDILAQMFPQCATPSALADPNGTQVPVHASRRDGDLGLASATRASFGMALWVAMILHVLGIEFYLRATASESNWLRRWPEERGPGASQEQMELPYRSSWYEGSSCDKLPLLKY